MWFTASAHPRDKLGVLKFLPPIALTLLVSWDLAWRSPGAQAADHDRPRPTAITKSDCYLITSDGRRVNLDGRLCDRNAQPQALPSTVSVGALQFMDLELRANPDPSVVVVRGRVQNRSNGPIALQAVTLNLVYQGTVAKTVEVAIAPGQIAPGQTLGFERLVAHGLGSTVALEEIGVAIASYRQR